MRKRSIISALAGLSLVACNPAGRCPVPTTPLEECCYQGSKTLFSVWAPDADAAVLRVYDSASDADAEMSLDMKKSRDGLWKCTVKEDIKGKFYTFQLMHDGQWLPQTQGIAAKAVAVNGTRGAVIDWAETNPEGWESDKSPSIKPSDIIIYEMHHRDFSIHPS